MSISPPEQLRREVKTKELRRLLIDQVRRDGRLQIPLYMHEGLINYVVHHIRPGSFLQALISNDLFAAASKADDVNKDHLYEYVVFFYNWSPGACWGSPEKMEAWIKQGMEENADG